MQTTSNSHRKYSVYYGVDKLNKIMKKPRLSVVFLNEADDCGDWMKREKKVYQRMHVIHHRYQTLSETKFAHTYNRIFTTYGFYIFEKPINGDVEYMLEQNFLADQNHISEKERTDIRNKLRKKIYQLYPETKKGGTQLNLIFE
jgi:uncharacterized cysteine cluster protein YcgN (CxxCxxCC family)